MSTCNLLRRKLASEYLRETHGIERAPSTLAKLAVTGGGPIFRRVGRVPLYAPEDLDDWAGSKFSAPMRSTSDVASPKDSTTDLDRIPKLADEQKHNYGTARKKSSVRKRASVS